MNLEAIIRARGLAAGKAARAALVGAGEFGATFIAQTRRMDGLEVVAVCDRDPQRAQRAALAGGFGADEIVACDSGAAGAKAIAAGKVALIPDAAMLSDLSLEVVVEATGDPEGAASTALAAIEAGRHVAVATKEAESVVGAELARRAAAKGVVYTLVDGDQPSLLIGLVAWAKLLGLPIVAGGKSSESDFVWDPQQGTVTAWGHSEPAAVYRDLFVRDEKDLVAALAKRDLPAFARTTVPDLCEMGIVSNHTGLMPDIAELHAPIARTVELPLLFRPREHGGLLGRTGVVDMFNCLRRPDELSFAGGVFVIVETPDPTTGRVLAGKGIPASADGRYLMLHNPVHLLGAEAPMSVLSAIRFGCSTGGHEVRPRVDLVARARRDLAPGEALAMGARHSIEALDHQLLPARPLGPENPVPYYLAAGRRVRTPVKAGEVLTGAHLEIGDSTLLKLRQAQDAHFLNA